MTKLKIRNTPFMLNWTEASKKVNLKITTGILMGAIVLGGISACSPSTKTTANTSGSTPVTNPATTLTTKTTTSTVAVKSNAKVETNNVPTAVSNVTEYGEDIYDAAKANDWQQASAKLASLKNTANSLDSVIKSEDPNEDKLDDAIANLNKAVQAKDKLATMSAANQVTLLATNLSASFHPPVPVQVSLLDYYGRQLEIGVAANNTKQLQATAKDVQKTWNELRPAVESKGATAEAQKFDNLVTQLQAASSTNDYSRLATAVLNEVDNLEKVFKP